MSLAFEIEAIWATQVLVEQGTSLLVFRGSALLW